MTVVPNNVAILGMGLMGGSLGLALRKRHPRMHVHGYARRKATREAAMSMGAVERVFDDPAAAVVNADIAILCVPVLATAELAREAGAGSPPECVFTDVGSTKAEVMRVMRSDSALGALRFVGSHPIAGSHRTGIEAAREDLYENAVVVVTQAPGEDDAARDLIESVWTHAGARVIRMGAEEHDAMLARTSHLPHLAAAALVETVLGAEAEAVMPFCGSGFRDTTRVAAGAEDIWRDICLTNRSDISTGIRQFTDVLKNLADAIDAGDSALLGTLLESARKKRMHFDGETNA